VICVVGVITYQRLELLKACLASIKNNLPNDDNTWEIVVSDDGSDDGTVAWLSLRHSGINFITGKRGGVARNSNRIIEHFNRIGGDVLFLLNDDVQVMGSPAFSIYLEAIQEWNYHHFVFNDPKSPHGKASIWNKAGRNTRLNLYNMGDGAFMVFTRQALTVLGGFDTRYGMFSAEHCDISQRAIESGLCPAVIDVAGSEEFIRTIQYHEPIRCSVGRERNNYLAAAHKEWVRFNSEPIEIWRPVET
jgi:glycosyltransferase involved in cell wall biosynthesis